MKQFNLEEYLANPRKVITRDGRNVRIICTDFYNHDFPVVGEIKGHKWPLSFATNGTSIKGRQLCGDLFFAPEKKIGWTNIYKYTFGGTHLGEVIYNSKEEAENNAKVYETDINTYITTIKIEWEE